MNIASRYIDALEEAKAELIHVGWITKLIRKTIDDDEVFRGDWTSNDMALTLDDLREDLKQVEHYLDLATEELVEILEREVGR